MNSPELLTYQWIILLSSSLLLILISPVSRTVNEFFSAQTPTRVPGVFLLTSSLVISWIFAKSITIAANLGAEFGLVGGVAYAGYYLSFLVAGIVIYRMRTAGGFTSMHQFLSKKYGVSAVVVFSLLITFRLFNEVWSNTMVIGTYFGEKGSGRYYLSILVFTLLTLAYTWKGGLRGSLFTDMIQMMLFGVLLFVILQVLLPRQADGVARFVQSGSWTWYGGLNLLFVALVQIISYPFHDPVMTDRGFLSSPRTTLHSFALATGVGILCIVLFSFVGIYARLQALQGEAAVAVSQSLGMGMTLLINCIMVTSAASTLDSTFASFSKLASKDLAHADTLSVSKGRLSMAIIAVAGTLPVFLGPEILSATTISGTMVIGLAPVFLCWKVKAPPAAFFLSVLTGIVFGLLFAFGLWSQELSFTPGPYNALLAVNLVGTLACFFVFFLTKLLYDRKN